jgi:hypothetical protein
MKSLVIILTLLSSVCFGQVNRFIDPGQTASISYTQGMPSTPSGSMAKFAAAEVITNTTPAGLTFTCAITNICTATAHGLITGTVGQASTTGSLPTGLTTSTNYYVINLTANTFSLASTLAHALAGTAITISGTGSPTNTFTATTLSGSVALQGSMDGITYFNLPIRATGDATKSGSFTGSGTVFLSEDTVNVNYIRSNYTITSGQFTLVETRKSVNSAMRPY